MKHLALIATQRKKIKKYLEDMSRRAAYTLAISAIVLSTLDDHKKNLKKTRRITNRAK